MADFAHEPEYLVACEDADWKASRTFAALAQQPTGTEASRGERVTLDYTNYRGERATRTITPWSIEWGSTDWHPEPGWLLTCYDHDKHACRTYALSGINPHAGLAFNMLRAATPTPPLSPSPDSTGPASARAKIWKERLERAFFNAGGFHGQMIEYAARTALPIVLWACDASSPSAREALKPFSDAWQMCLDIGEQGGGYVQDDERAWISGSAGGGSYTMFKFGDLRRAHDVLASLPAPAGDVPGEAQTQAARDVLAERCRQVEAEGWTTEHDDAHGNGELARAAAAYARHAGSDEDSRQLNSGYSPEDLWPWLDHWRPSTPRRDLVKAGALILAEIERLDRLSGEAQTQEGGR